MSFIADSDLQVAVASALGFADPSALPANYVANVTLGNIQAYGFIRRTLASKRYTPAQIAQWDDGIEFNTRLGVCRVFQLAALRGEEPPPNLSEYCEVAAELKADDFPFTIGGVLVVPLASPSRISTGAMDTSNDRFKLGPPYPPGSVPWDGTTL